MKTLLAIIILSTSFLSFAVETETDCPAMNESREKKLIVTKESTKKQKTSTQQ